MNNDRRKALSAIITRTEELKNSQALTDLLAKLEDLKTDIDDIKNDEQEYYDNMPESLQGGEKGQLAEAAVSALDEACDAVQELVDALDFDDKLDDVIGKINEAQE